MKVTLNKSLHERALAIIELIELADSRIEMQERNKKEIPSVFFNIQEHADKRIASLRAAQMRLHKSYTNTLIRINQAK